jgi:hypothetical protein
MAFHNTNWTAVPMAVGTYTLGDLGNGLTASTVHQIFCTGAGSITISAMGGGTFTWSATAGQKVDVVCSKVIVSSGTFVGFKAAFQPNYVQSLMG